MLYWVSWDLDSLFGDNPVVFVSEYVLYNPDELVRYMYQPLVNLELFAAASYI